MKKDLFIVKAGGKILDDEKQLSRFLNGFSALDAAKMLVHGGGKTASGIAERLGYKPVLVEGRRITDANMLKVVTMTYGGLLNKNLVARLQSLHVNALGLTGADGNIILAKKRPKTVLRDYGWVGDPVAVNVQLLRTLLDAGIVPVIAPLTHDGNGHMLNTNADTIAAVLTSGLKDQFNVHLIYAFELSGVMENVEDPASVIRELDKKRYEQLKKSGGIFEGMIPKLDNAFDALDSGARTVRIVNYAFIAEITNKEYHEYTLIR